MASFSQFLGGTLGLAAAEACFSSELGQKLNGIPDNIRHIILRSPVDIWTLDSNLIPRIVSNYVDALDIVFSLSIAVGGISFILAFFIKNIRIKKKAPPKASEDLEKGNSTKTEETAISSKAHPSDLQDTASAKTIEIDPPVSDNVGTTRSSMEIYEKQDV